MRAALLLPLLALDVYAQSGARFRRLNERCPAGRSSRGLGCDGLAFEFEFAPASGSGMGAYCACTAITGANGEAMTFTRSGTATCSRQGLATTGIANGDLVTCATDQPRVERLGGVPGLRVESTRTNETPRSQEIDNAAWTNVATIVANPTLNAANAAVAPDGTTTAEDYTFPATAAGQQSIRLGATIPTVCNSVSCSHTIFVRGFSGVGTVDICSWDTGTPDCVGCAFTDTSWSRCSITVVNSGSVAVGVGNSTLWNGGAARASNRVFVWGAQSEVGTHPTSYIPTVSAAVTRNEETVFRDETQFGELMGGAGGSVAATAQCLNTASRRIVTLATSGGSTNVEWDVNFPSGAVAVTQWFTGATSTFTSTLAIESAIRRWAQFTSGAGSTLNICRDGVCQAGGSRGANQSGATGLRIHVGNYVSGAFRCDGIVTGVCVSQSPSRCR